MLQHEYFSTLYNCFTRIEDFQFLDEDRVIDLVLEWFYENYENPNEHCPIDQGEYLYIYGGPIRADEAIYEEFGGYVENDLLEKILNKIPERYDNLSLVPDYKWSDYTSNDPFYIFKAHIDDIKRLSIIPNRNKDLHSKYLGLLFVNTLTTIETFLADTLIDMIYQDELCLARFIDSVMFNSKKAKNLQLREEYKNSPKKYFDKMVSKINSITFHTAKNLNLFTKILNIKISTYDSELIEFTDHRNNIVHRNGKAKNNTNLKDTQITLEQLNNCISTIQKIVYEINDKLIDTNNVSKNITDLKQDIENIHI